jgi:hypothetical protein
MTDGGLVCRCGQRLPRPREGGTAWGMCARCCNQALTERLEALIATLLPGARRDGRWARCGDLSGAPGGSLAIEIAGRRRGRWKDFAADEEHGDPLDLVRLAPATGCSGDLDRAMRWAGDWLRLPPREVPPALRHAERRPPTAEETRSYMRRIWREAQPIVGTLAWHYLTKTRGIAGLEALGPLPALRFHPALKNAQLQARVPALVAAIADADGHFAALHRTYLTRRQGAVVKAPVPDELGGAKRSIGYYRGGCVPLWRGKTGRPWRDPAPGEALGIAEGIEDGLTLAVHKPVLRVVVAVSLSNMSVMTLPAAIGDVFIAAQNDPAGSPAARTLERAVAHFRNDLKRRVFVLRPPQGTKDINDLQLEIRRRA